MNNKTHPQNKKYNDFNTDGKLPTHSKNKINSKSKMMLVDVV